MKRYPKYKDSGVKWIGKKPEEWKIIRLKYISKIVTGNTPSKKDDNNYEEGKYLWVKPDELNGFYPTNDTKEKLTVRGRGLSRTIPSHSVFVNGIGNIGRFGYSEKEVSTNQQINSVIFNKKCIPRFGLYLIAILHDEFIKNAEKVVVPILNKSRQENIKLVLPKITEQKQIVSFLDNKTKKIDKLVEKTEKKIELLKEKRVALINHCVTKGLPQEGKYKNEGIKKLRNEGIKKYKDSGIEWIGEIPSHWELRRVNSFGTFSKGRGISKDEIKEYGIPCIRYGEIYTQYNRLVKKTVSFINDESSKNSELIKKGDVLFTGSGETVDEIGKTVVYYGDDDIFVGGDIIILKLKNNLNPLFISYLMNSNYVNYQKSSMGRGEIVVHIYSKQLKEIKVILPPLPEQKQIVQYLDTQTQKIDTLIEKETKRIELLKEYRQALISEVVTGKVDVREN